MGLIGRILLITLGLVATILVPVIARLITDDIKEWLPWIRVRLIERAVQKLPKDQQERYAEEWSAFVDETPGDLSKIFRAFGLGVAADSIADLSPGALMLVLKRTRRTVRRAIDVGVGMLLVALNAPALLLIALAVKIDSPGPVMVWREFPGSNGKTVKLLTFRTMHVRAKAKCSYGFYNSNGIHNSSDARVTRIGRLLRRLNLDQAPQIINLIRGEVSFRKSSDPDTSQPTLSRTTRQEDT